MALIERSGSSSLINQQLNSLNSLNAPAPYNSSQAGFNKNGTLITRKSKEGSKISGRGGIPISTVNS